MKISFRSQDQEKLVGLFDSPLMCSHFLIYFQTKEHTIGEAKKLGVTNIISRWVAPSREISIPANNFYFFN